jgi:hypothetical protein
LDLEKVREYLSYQNSTSIRQAADPISDGLSRNSDGRTERATQTSTQPTAVESIKGERLIVALFLMKYTAVGGDLV